MEMVRTSWTMPVDDEMVRKVKMERRPNPGRRRRRKGRTKNYPESPTQPPGPFHILTKQTRHGGGEEGRAGLKDHAGRGVWRQWRYTARNREVQQNEIRS